MDFFNFISALKTAESNTELVTVDHWIDPLCEPESTSSGLNLWEYVYERSRLKIMLNCSCLFANTVTREIILNCREIIGWCHKVIMLTWVVPVFSAKR